MRTLRYISGLLIALMTGCQNISCPLENTVALRLATYLDGEAVTIGDTLSVTAAGTDSILLNRLYKFSKFQLPVHQQPQGEVCDTFILHWALAPAEEGDASPQYVDTLYVNHIGTIHFETIDCPPAIFHEITNVKHTRVLLDRVSLEKSSVDYETSANLHLHLHTPAQ